MSAYLCAGIVALALATAVTCALASATELGGPAIGAIAILGAAYFFAWAFERILT